MAALFVLRVQAGESGGNGNTTVDDSDFTVTIPAEVSIDSTTKQAELLVNIKLKKTNKLTVNISSGNQNNLINGDDKIGYTLNQTSLYEESTSVTSQTHEANKTIKLSVDSQAVPKYAGEYTDQLTFAISSESVNYIDLNGILDGEEISGGNIDGIASVPIYVDGNSWGNCTDVWSQQPVGTTFKADVDNIRVNDGYTYVGSKDDTEKTVTKDVKWVRIDLMFVTNYTLTLNACGGSCDVSSLSVGQSLNYYDKIDNIIPTREGYTFDGWYTAEAGVIGADKITEENAVMEASNTTIYAHWSKEGVPEFYLDFNSYDLDEQTHHETIGEYGSATIKINGNETSHDYGQVANGTTFEISNMKATKDGYEYKGCYICYHPTREGEELAINQGSLNTSSTISGTVEQYTSVFLVFGKINSSDTIQAEENVIQTTSLEDKTVEKEKTAEKSETETTKKTEMSEETTDEVTADTSKGTASDTEKKESEIIESGKTDSGKAEGNTDSNSEEKTETSGAENSSSADSSGGTEAKDTSGSGSSNTADNTSGDALGGGSEDTAGNVSDDTASSASGDAPEGATDDASGNAADSTSGEDSFLAT